MVKSLTSWDKPLLNSPLSAAAFQGMDGEVNEEMRAEARVAMKGGMPIESRLL